VLSVLLNLLFFSTEPTDWLGRTSPKWHLLCQVERKTLLHPFVKLHVTPTVAISAARVWNGLPSDVITSPLLTAFKWQLKTQLFSRSFDLWQSWLTFLTCMTSSLVLFFSVVECSWRFFWLHGTIIIFVYDSNNNNNHWHWDSIANMPTSSKWTWTTNVLLALCTHLFGREL